MQREVDEWIRDIVAAGREIAAYIDGLDQGRFEADLKTVRAVAYLLLSIGEAAKNLPSEYLERHAEVDWRGLKGMRDILAHRYFGLDLQILWVTVKGELPGLVARLEAPLEADERGDVGQHE